MQIRTFFSLCSSLLFFLFFTINTGFAQQVSTNVNGDKIVLFEDGSWRYFDPATDAELERAQTLPTNNKQVESTVAKSKKAKGKKEKKAKTPKVKKAKKVKKVKNKKGKQPKANKKSKKAKKVKKTKKNKKTKKVKKIKSGKKGKKSKGKKIVKAEATPAAIQRSEQLAFRRAERAAAEAAKQKRILEEASLDRVFLEEELQAAYGNLESTDSDIAEIEGRLQIVRGKEQLASQKYVKVEEDAALYSKMMTMSYAKREKMLAKMALENRDESLTNTMENGEAPVDEMSKEQKKKAKDFKLEREQLDVMNFPPQKPCNLVFDGLDEFSGKVRKEMGKEMFFTFTSAKMKPYFKDKDYLTCKAAITAVSGGVYYFNMDVEIASETAQREYGFLEKGAVLIIKMIDGSSVRLVNRKTDMGTLNPLQKSVIFKPQYLIGSNQVKELSKGEVDKIRLVWSTGYDDFEVYELDFFINQFRCLEDK